MSMKKFLVTLIAVIALICIVANTTIFGVSENDDIKQLQRNNEICILHYEYVTGAGWMVIDSTREDLIGEYVVLENCFDPRLLRENLDFDMDYMSDLVVCFDDMTSTKIDNEDVSVIIAKSIEILYDTAKTNYKVKDMTLSGMLKFAKGVFDKKFWYSY